MKLTLAILAAALLSSSPMFADTISVQLNQSNENYTLMGTGGSNGYGTYLAQQGSCVPGASNTTCTLTGTYTGTTAGYTAGTYSLITTYSNADGGLPATSKDPVNSPSGGNYFVLGPFPTDADMVLYLKDTLAGMETVDMVVDGKFVADSYLIDATNSVCSGLPAGQCTQGNVGLSTTGSVSSPVTGEVIFDIPGLGIPTAQTPEPAWLALGGMFPGVIMVVRRRLSRAA